jgi:glycosyltransferase involved in cell wall biosynthesis
MLFNPKVSIIIPVYNGSNYLKEAIDSALAQTYENIEVIVINDGSTDKGKTEEIALSYGDRIRYFYKENGGVSSALNAGIKMAKGDYISWLSHDDAFLPNKLEVQLQCLRNEPDRDKIILFSDYKIMDDCSNIIGKYHVPLSKPNNMLLDLLAFWPVHGCTTLIPKKCFDIVGLFDEDNRTTQDYDMWFRLLKYNYCFVHISQSLIRFRMHQQQDSLKTGDSHQEERERTYVNAITMFSNELKTFTCDDINKAYLGLRETKGLPEAANLLLKSQGKHLLQKSAVVPMLKSFIKRLILICLNLIKNIFIHFIGVRKAGNTSKTILFVAMSDSIHTARWVSQIADQGWHIHLFPSVDIGEVHPQLNNVTVHHFVYTKTQRKKDRNPTVKNRGFYIPFNPSGITSNFILAVSAFINRYLPDSHVRQLRRLIKKLEPDIIHSLEFQHSGYLTFQALYQNYMPLTVGRVIAFPLKRFYSLLYDNTPQIIKNVMKALKNNFNGSGFPHKKPIETVGEKEPGSFITSSNRFIGQSSKWIATNWGSDIYLFGRLAEHTPKIREVLATCDYYSCECERDVALARSYGFSGKVLPVFPNTGGFDLEKVSKLRQPGPTSERRLIMLKGYHGWAYRGLVGLRALERCADLLKGYTVAIYLGFSPEIKIAAELFMHSTGLPVIMIPYVSHDEMLRYHGQARVSIGVNISDSISTSFLEALVMGSFPIQTYTSCANEWIEDGKTGILIPPEDPDVIEKAIRRALTDDDLVNRAAEENWKTAIERLDHKKLKSMVVDFYNTVFRETEDIRKG